MNDATTTEIKPRSAAWLSDLLASIVVFLVALPLCIGIAVACGVPAERGLITGIVGGIAVGLVSGAPLLVSGPAASLIVPVVDVIGTHGVAALGPVVVLAGVWQLIAGLLRLGQWFRAVAPAVIVGMLVGIGLLILASQLHVAIDAAPRASFVDNVSAFPATLLGSAHETSRLLPLAVSASTVALIVAWDVLKPAGLGLVPGQLVALVAVTAVSGFAGLDVEFLEVSPQFFAGLGPLALADFTQLAVPDLAALSLMFAFVSSAATLLTANAIDQQQTRSKANYDKELFAQGLGNVLAGGVGGLPMTGVIVRSSVNVDAGARTRLSTIMHGAWILVFVSVAPQVLELIPKSSLGGILVYTGFRLVDRDSLVALYRQGRAELAICLITLGGVVFIDLFTGILAGLAAATCKIVYTFARLEIRTEAGAVASVQELYLSGSATFLHLPRLAAALERVPLGRELHVHIDQLDHIDHACLELLSAWHNRRTAQKRPGMVVEWSELTDRYRQAVVGSARSAPSGQLIMSTIWEEWKRAYAFSLRADSERAAAEPFVDARRVRVRVEAKSINDVLRAAAASLAEAVGQPPSELYSALRERIQGHVALGGGVSVPHTPIDGLDRSVAAMVVTREAVAVGADVADVFFVLLAPAEDPRKHLQALAHVGRLCHHQGLLRAVRQANTAGEAARLLRLADSGNYDTAVFVGQRRLLAVVEVSDPDRIRALARMIEEAFGRCVSASSRTEPAATVRRALDLPPASHLLLIALAEGDVPVLLALLHEEKRVVGGEVCPVYVMRPEALSAPK